MFTFHVLSLLGSPAFKVLQKMGVKILFQALAKKYDWLNENLSQATIFLATTLISTFEL